MLYYTLHTYDCYGIMTGHARMVEPDGGDSTDESALDSVAYQTISDMVSGVGDEGRLDWAPTAEEPTLPTSHISRLRADVYKHVETADQDDHWCVVSYGVDSNGDVVQLVTPEL